MQDDWHYQIRRFYLEPIGGHSLYTSSTENEIRSGAMSSRITRLILSIFYILASPAGITRIQ